MSAAQDVYISPRQIISYLMEFEKRLPKPSKNYYLPGLSVLPITNEALNQEAKRMMDFIGLTSYKPKCKFEELKEGIGGNTLCCNNNIEVEINVSTKYRNNLEACLAVLAHEVCHKYLYVHGIYYPIEIINEIYTDLCTMYVGFGNIIKKGYITETKRQERSEKCITTYTNTQYLGYLKYPIYERTLRIIRMVLWDEDGLDIYSTEQDPLLQDTFKEWSTKKDKKALSKDSLMKVGKGIAELERNFYLLRRLINLMTSRYNRAFEQAEETLYQEEWFDGENVKSDKRFSVFNGIYQSIVLGSTDDHNDVLNESNSYLRQIIVQIADKARLNNPLILKSTDFTCPHCRTHHESDKFSGRRTMIKCPNCKKRFIVDCQDFDSMAARNELDRYKDELVRPIRKGYHDSLENEKKSHFNKGYAEGSRAKEIEITKKFQTKISKLPYWLRLLIGKRLN